MNQYKRHITRSLLLAFVVSWFGLIGQASAHTFMMIEMQQHQAMGHDMGAHCQPVLCESVISLDDQINYGLDSLKIIDLNAVPAVAIQLVLQDTGEAQREHSRYSFDHGPPPPQLSGILRI